MRAQMIFLVFLFCLTMACPSFAEDLQLTMEARNRGVDATIVNLSMSPVRVNRVFTRNPAFGVLQLHIQSGKKEFGLLVPPNEEMANDNSYIMLLPYNIVGQHFSMKDLRKSYGLGKGCYVLYAIYRDVMAKQFNASRSELISNKLRICLS
jgi:hypothetical protein